ncbi:dihydroorotate dehydrogenase electron transfer subunit [Alkaliphilus hydrothermalis]|uniref:Dihydroorotate dehydrogenase B (NAD(+)), electron transfer subunit n=1 Tax=Alkaliphilus hydrothermalis TaxID=1482730 RepID=A0ABS2NMZ0_9FIRM|nr:dihydroorotate dehydrogenase electron transfer subunit [Alkaliphilus hydrothermalis]MBM7614298.1 dihydroorotate dehydrogenase electron transfer subunit [Alkaliphilus hydrothermalis]
MKKKVLAKVLLNEAIAPNNFKMVISAKEMTVDATAGQFVNLYCNRGELLLPRPISICEVNKETGEMTLVYAVVGKGTKELSQMKKGETLGAMGPLGRGFEVSYEVEEHLIIAGGIGVPPMVELVKSLKGNITVYLGFRSNPILVEEFEAYGAVVHVATEDGSVGLQGNVMGLIKEHQPKPQMIYSCGPKPMLKAVADWSKAEDIPTQLSLEERMACGIGACLVCTCRTKKQEDTDWENRRVCKDGPVFWRDEVIWND